MSKDLTVGCHSVSTGTCKHKSNGGGVRAAAPGLAIAPPTTAKVAPPPTSASPGTDDVAAAAQRAREQASRVIAIQAQLDEVRADAARITDKDRIPAGLIELERRLTVQLEVDNPKKMEVAYDSRLCQIEAKALVCGWYCCRVPGF